MRREKEGHWAWGPGRRYLPSTPVLGLQGAPLGTVTAKTHPLQATRTARVARPLSLEEAASEEKP